MVKIYAWTAATPNSKKVNTNKIRIGKRFATKKKSPIKIIVQLNPTITFKRVCPAIIFAKSRTERLTNRKVYEINSIGTKINIKGTGDPDGKKRLKK